MTCIHPNYDQYFNNCPDCGAKDLLPDEETYEALHDRMQPVYRQFLADNDIPSGDVSPELAGEFEAVELQLARVIERWIEQLGEVAA